MKRSPLRRTPMKRKPPRRGAMDPMIHDGVLRRDGWRCRAHAMGFALDIPCHGRLHVHHRHLRSQGGTDDMENLVTLCDTHHRHAHDVDRAGAEAVGVILRTSANPPPGGKVGG